MAIAGDKNLKYPFRDLSNPSATCLKPASLPSVSHGAAGAFIAPSSEAIVCAGVDSATGLDTRDCHNFDAGSNSWTESASKAPLARTDFSAVSLPDGRWWLTGGTGHEFSTDIYDGNGDWDYGAGILPPATFHCAMQVRPLNYNK